MCVCVYILVSNTRYSTFIKRGLEGRSVFAFMMVALSQERTDGSMMTVAQLELPDKLGQSRVMISVGKLIFGGI